jgi:hypothetical protein
MFRVYEINRYFGVFGIDPDDLEPCENPEHVFEGVK